MEEEALLWQIKSTTNIDTEILGKRKCKPGTIKKNPDRIRQHTIALDDVNTQLGANSIDIFQELDKTKKRKMLVDRKNCHLTELKKAQDQRPKLIS